MNPTHTAHMNPTHTAHMNPTYTPCWTQEVAVSASSLPACYVLPWMLLGTQSDTGPMDMCNQEHHVTIVQPDIEPNTVNDIIQRV